MFSGHFSVFPSVQLHFWGVGSGVDGHVIAEDGLAAGRGIPVARTGPLLVL